ncbi:hypothetical protein Q75_14850 [Bacillus coahuilensis p1.1.43]|uniref:Uncharacterized protein n=1 Tax=Bacillus coahuilensis p1.1.43 TaxID=1150625 RepID=A0A147K538_9BACI|nr:DUF5986 family protein [Bacillus coahuilensis]KUP04722.1 hypothetical protein Q75_14850 [Bacillus coahuilensis p1.1.43]
METFQIPINENVKKDIYRSIQNGLSDMEDFSLREKLTFQNGFPQLKWAYIFTRLFHGLHIENGEVLRGKRGPWPLVMIYDEATSYLYVVIEKEKF